MPQLDSFALIIFQFWAISMQRGTLMTWAHRAKATLTPKSLNGDNTTPDNTTPSVKPGPALSSAKCQVMCMYTHTPQTLHMSSLVYTLRAAGRLANRQNWPQRVNQVSTYNIRAESTELHRMHSCRAPLACKVTSQHPQTTPILAALKPMKLKPQSRSACIHTRCPLHAQVSY